MPPANSKPTLSTASDLTFRKEFFEIKKQERIAFLEKKKKQREEAKKKAEEEKEDDSNVGEKRKAGDDQVNSPSLIL